MDIISQKTPSNAGNAIDPSITPNDPAGRVLLSHKGYRLRIGRIEMAFPIGWLIGHPSAWEEAIDDKTFRMEMKVAHPIWGTLYSYAGQFKIAEIELEQ